MRLDRLVLLLLLQGCIPPVGPGWPTRTPTPGQVKPTATPRPVPPASPFQATTGHAVLVFSGLDALPLAPTRDNLILAVLTWEVEGLDRKVPVLELAMRGTTADPCLSRGRFALCRDKAGLVPRFSADLAFDDTLPWDAAHEADSQTKACGAGLNVHQRLAVGPYGPGGTLVVEVKWTPDQVTVRTPVDSWTYRPRVAGTVGFGRVIAGSPWTRAQARSWLWNTFSSGAGVAVVDWTGVSGPIGACP